MSEGDCLQVPIRRDKYGRSFQIPVDQIIDGVLKSQPELDFPNTTPQQMLERLGRFMYPLPSEEDFRQCAMGVPMLRMCDTRDGKNYFVDVGEFSFDEESKIKYTVIAGDPKLAPGLKVEKAVYALCVGSSIRWKFPESSDAFGFCDF